MESELERRVGQFLAELPGELPSWSSLDVDRSRKLFAAGFDVDAAAVAAAGLAQLVNGHHSLDPDRVVAMFAGKVWKGGEQVQPWADLSGYYETGDDELVQVHCNFAHHATGLLAELGFPAGVEVSRDEAAAAMRQRSAEDVEARMIAAGMIAARLRTPQQWSEHPHAVATADLPVISVERIGDAPPRPVARQRRVLDCSRVLAGPVAGSVFAANGGDVVRVSASHLPSVEIGVIATGADKRNVDIDLRATDGRATFATLLADADVWVDAYRPGALAGHGFDLDSIAPGTVAVQLSAFDWVGPWAGRRGFDSIVQSTTGIVRGQMAAVGSATPTPLPVQALDYCTGLLAAAAAEHLVQHQAEHGGTWLVKLSLLRTRNWLVGDHSAQPFEPAPIVPSDPALQTMPSEFGTVTIPKPLCGEWRSGPRQLGTAEPRWVSSAQ